jgi:hypothetical protein
MINKIADLIDYNIEKHTEDIIIDEFNSKYSFSYIKINGTIFLFIKMYKENNINTLHVKDIKNLTHKIIDVKNIEKVTPPTGLYVTENKIIYLYRSPHKQYTPSLKLGQNYSCLNLETRETNSEYDLWDTVFNSNSKFQKESIIFNNNVYLYWNKIGITHKQLKKTLIIDTKFIEEAKELWKQYQIFSESDPHPEKVENLKVVF